MTPFGYLQLYLATAFIFLVIDLLWLGVIARPFYRNNLGKIINLDFSRSGAMAFYLVYIVGILVFAVVPALISGSIEKAALWGTLFGFFTYATYDLTNMATIKAWPLEVTVVDICWGSFLGGTVASLSFWVGTAI